MLAILFSPGCKKDDPAPAIGYWIIDNVQTYIDPAKTSWGTITDTLYTTSFTIADIRVFHELRVVHSSFPQDSLKIRFAARPTQSGRFRLSDWPTSGDQLSLVFRDPGASSNSYKGAIDPNQFVDLEIRGSNVYVHASKLTYTIHNPGFPPFWNPYDTKTEISVDISDKI